MAQLWKGRFKKELAKETNDFNSSITFDSRMYEQDIKGSIAHATMLGASGIIDKSESEKIVNGLEEILSDIKSGKLEIDMTAEDIHTFVEGELTARLGQTGKRLHTARSRNDQVALDIRLTLRDEADEVIKKLKKLVGVLCDKAEEHCDTIMPGYTHLQRAQPITFGHHLMAYASMLLRDINRIEDAKKRMNICPLGSGALAGTTYPIDRKKVADLLGFDGITSNSLDGVSDRDFCIELASALTTMKALPLAYNKDMQEDKEAIFDAFDTVKMCLNAFTPMIETMTVLKENMRHAAAKGFINATDCADYLVGKGLPFRDAYKCTGELVALCIDKGLTLETLPLEEYKAVCNLFDDEVYKAINLEKCVRDRKADGSPCPENVLKQVKAAREML